SASLRAQAAKRGFLMTSDETFLTPYREATTAVNRIHDGLIQLVHDRPRQQVRLQQAGARFQQWLYDVAHRRVTARQKLPLQQVEQAHQLEKNLLKLQDAHMRSADNGRVDEMLVDEVRSTTRSIMRYTILDEHVPLLEQALRLLDSYEESIAVDDFERASRALRDCMTILTRTIQAILDVERRITRATSEQAGQSLLNEFHVHMNEFIDAEKQRLKAYEAAMAAAETRAHFILWAGPALGLLLMIVITSWMSRHIARSVEGISRAARGLARGDLGSRALVEGSDEFAVLAERFNSMAELVENRSRESAALAELGELLQSSTSTNEAARIFADLAPRLFPQQPGALYLMAPSRDEVVALATWQEGETFSTTEFVPEDCWALRLSRAHENREGNAVRCLHLATRHDDSVCLPLHAFGETLGMLFTTHPSDGFPQGSVGAEQHREFMDTVAEQLALALANLRMRETLRHQSIRDPLTQLYNRRYLEETFRRELHRAARRGKSLSVLTFDIDHFKRFNDLHGHDGGDALLKAVGNCLRDFFRAEDGAFRSGGEEFVAVLPETSIEDAATRAEALREQISELEVQHGDLVLPAITISVGIAAFPQHGDTPDQLLKAADTALYRAKKAGRNRVCLAE
ncbi:MAG: diguanylate cyclase, partial [Proteobacteria bacterium]|nr:diguanylate cyclase [Pseudomonadota bacterium]